MPRNSKKSIDSYAPLLHRLHNQSVFFSEGEFKDNLMKRMLGDLHNILHFMKNLSLHNDLQRFQRSPHNRASLLY
ncbi:hypothetical protein ILYODFUR_031562 [Ilyodon furcidens]|uniref:Uncharacterized protein n=1 Tax=Ilyodon furcidens TaxID=33524 RepID=A0ABV0U150_9TELE